MELRDYGIVRYKPRDYGDIVGGRVIMARKLEIRSFYIGREKLKNLKISIILTQYSVILIDNAFIHNFKPN